MVADNSFRQAEAVLRSYLAIDPRSADAHKLLAYCLLRQNRPKEALPEYTSAAQIEPPTAEDLKNVAQAYTLLGDDADATRWGTLAVQRGPADPNAWYSLGRIHYTAQRYQAAVKCFRQTLALAPRSVKAENNLGLALEGLNHSDEAVAAYQQAIAWGDADGQLAGMEQPLLNLSIVLIHRDRIDEALPLLKRAARVAPKDPKIHEQLGHVYLQKENLSAAAAEFEQAAALDPSNSALHFLLGQTYRRQGLKDKAQQEFARAAAMMGTHSSEFKPE
jgi:tetratricopeptide (TPR) repeat protein